MSGGTAPVAPWKRKGGVRRSGGGAVGRSKPNIFHGGEEGGQGVPTAARPDERRFAVGPKRAFDLEGKPYAELRIDRTSRGGRNRLPIKKSCGSTLKSGGLLKNPKSVICGRKRGLLLRGGAFRCVCVNGDSAMSAVRSLKGGGMC